MIENAPLLALRSMFLSGYAHRVMNARFAPCPPGIIGLRIAVYERIVDLKPSLFDRWVATVNTVSRMESSGDVGQVNISEATYALVKNEASFNFTPRGKAQGKGEMEMYFVDVQQ